MDRQEKREQKKEKEREVQKKVDKAHEEQSYAGRWPIHPVVWIVGAVLTLAVVYFWTVGMW